MTLDRRTETDLVLVMCPGWGVFQPPLGIASLVPPMNIGRMGLASLIASLNAPF